MSTYLGLYNESVIYGDGLYASSGTIDTLTSNTIEVGDIDVSGTTITNGINNTGDIDTDTITISTGSISNPSLRFLGNTNYGLFYDSGYIYIVANGTAYMRLSASQFNTNVPLSIPSLILSGLSTGLLHSDISGNISSSLLVNSDVDTNASIQIDKLEYGNVGQLIIASSPSGKPKYYTISGDISISDTGVASINSGVIVNADINASASIAYSKLNLVNSITNSDLAGSIAYNKLVLTGSITNSDLAGSISLSKLVNGTSGQIIVCNGSGIPTYVNISGDGSLSSTGVLTVSSSTNLNLSSLTTGTNYITFSASQTGNNPLYTHSSLTYTPTTNTVGCSISGNSNYSNTSGSATQASTSFQINLLTPSTATTTYIPFATLASGNNYLYTDTGLTFNASTNVLSCSDYLISSGLSKVVKGPVSTTNNYITLFSGTTGDVIKASTITCSTNNLSGVGTISSGAITSSSTITGTDFIFSSSPFTDNRLLRANGTQQIQSSGITIDDTNNISGIGTLSSGAITSTSTITGTDIIFSSSPFTDNKIIRANGTQQIQSSGITIDDSNNMTGVSNIQLTGVSFDSGSNYLSFYTEGTFTMGLEDSSGNSFTVSSNTCSYTRIGNVCYFFCRVAWSGKGSAVAGDGIRFTNFPYTFRTTYGSYGRCIPSSNPLGSSAYPTNGTYLNINSVAGSTYCQMWCARTGASDTQILVSSVGTSGNTIFTLISQIQ